MCANLYADVLAGVCEAGFGVMVYTALAEHWYSACLSGELDCVGSINDLGWIRECISVTKPVWVLSTECLYRLDEGCNASE